MKPPELAAQIDQKDPRRRFIVLQYPKAFGEVAKPAVADINRLMVEPPIGGGKNQNDITIARRIHRGGFGTVENLGQARPVVLDNPQDQLRGGGKPRELAGENQAVQFVGAVVEVLATARAGTLPEQAATLQEDDARGKPRLFGRRHAIARVQRFNDRGK